MRARCAWMFFNFQCGTANSSHYVFERFILEPHFGGSKVNLIDPFNLGTNRVKTVAQVEKLELFKIFLRNILRRRLPKLFLERAQESGVGIEACHDRNIFQRVLVFSALTI